MTRADENRAAVESRLNRARAEQNLSLVLEPEALSEALGLTAALHDSDDVLGHFALGWLYWLRSSLLPEPQSRHERAAAVQAFVACFLAGLDGIPEPLMPTVAEHAVPAAERLLEQAAGHGSPQATQASVELWQRILESAPTDSSDRARYRAELNTALGLDYELSGSRDKFDETVQIMRGQSAAEMLSRLETLPPGPERSSLLAELRHMFLAMYEQSGDQNHLEVAVELAQAALRTSDESAPGHADHLAGVGSALWARYQRWRDPADLDHAIDLIRRASRLGTEEGYARASLLSNLGTLLRARYELRGVPDDLDASIARQLDALVALPDGHLFRGGFLHNLAMAYAIRSRRSGHSADLDLALQYGRQALAFPLPTGLRPEVLSAQATSLTTHFKRTGDAASLDEAIGFGWEAVADTRIGTPARATAHTTLGIALLLRFEHLGTSTDLDTALGILREAAGATPDPRLRTDVLTSLGNGLMLRFRRRGNPEDLDEAIFAAGTALADALHDPRLGMFLLNYGNALLQRYLISRDRADLANATNALQGANALGSNTSGQQARILGTLCDALTLQYDLEHRRRVRNEAIRAGTKAVRLTPGDDPDRARRLLGLGQALVRHGSTGRVSAIEAFAEAADAASSPPSDRILGAQNAAVLLGSDRSGRAADLLEAAVRLLPQVSPRRLDRTDQQYALGQFAGLGADAAASALKDPRIARKESGVRAARLLEAGRGVLLSHALEVRSDLTALREVRPDLAETFVQLRDRLDALDQHVTGNGDGPVPQVTGAAQTRRNQADSEFTETLARIRALDGFASFCRLPSAQELIAESAQGPLVVLNVTETRGDALLLTPSGVTVVELPMVSRSQVADQVAACYEALRAASDPRQGSRKRRAAQREMHGVLEWIWDAVAEPVLQTLGLRSATDYGKGWPRLWWIPGGLMSLLPLHAAGHHHDPAGDPLRRTVMDRVVSSYSPTVRALRHARRAAGPSAPVPLRPLLVAAPEPPGSGARLPHVLEEVAKVRALLPDARLLVSNGPSGAGAAPLDRPVKTNVLAHLPHSSIVHFACHGTTDTTDPSQSRLLLDDHSVDALTVASLARMDLDNARLVYLSACSTALSARTDLLDETVHLASACQLAGFRHVVGTLWEISDAHAPDMAERFYSHLRHNGVLDADRAATALHSAVRETRDQFPLAPTLWAAHLHVGA
ncbi:CHAT domain-containing protein [Streptomyces sp. Ncost-T10-10d]|uniref:CHAT domain-containing protein n=1 Tax=Streptomyces sp. Ncost-T10-10d TaxID=1839774 RepID=UPI00081D59CC|nr:CHAT domain-containing protein [Streptomyces sp. Ncost-T10-10d]SCF67625.1 CHAT domain-containing protein [Streptomyces sp. Ncost-T10-10d]